MSAQHAITAAIDHDAPFARQTMNGGFCQNLSLAQRKLSGSNRPIPPIGVTTN